MDNAKTDEALRACAVAVHRHVAVHFPDWEPLVASRWPVARSAPTSANGRWCHVLWMVDEALSWPAEQLEKKFRWLGFIQGAIWGDWVASIDEMRQMNAPSVSNAQDAQAP